MEFKAHKVVSSLPNILEPNTIYLVRVGSGFDLYCSDATGSIAHRVNNEILSNPFYQLKNRLISHPVAIGSYLDNSSGFMTALPHGTTTSNTAFRTNTFYLYPFCVFTSATIDRLAIAVTSVQNLNIRFGIYRRNGDQLQLIWNMTSNLDVSTTGTKLFTVDFNLLNTEIYYLAVVQEQELVVGYIRSFHSSLNLDRSALSVESQQDPYRISSRVRVSGLNFASGFPSTIAVSNFLADNDGFGLNVPFVGFRIRALL